MEFRIWVYFHVAHIGEFGSVVSGSPLAPLLFTCGAQLRRPRFPHTAASASHGNVVLVFEHFYSAPKLASFLRFLPPAIRLGQLAVSKLAPLACSQVAVSFVVGSIDRQHSSARLFQQTYVRSRIDSCPADARGSLSPVCD